MKYTVPDEYYFRIHHIRPRFKNDVEHVLVYIATRIGELSRMATEQFVQRMNSAIQLYPGNTVKTIKTINNWRTEISSLFGLIEFDSHSGECWPSAMSNNLCEKQDLLEFFKYFLFYFQYPGGHLKPHETYQFIKKGVRFKPAKYILNLLREGEEIISGRFGISKTELTHCVFNDLRVTRDDSPVDNVVSLILENRNKGLSYDWTGDVIRYAGDILDYMVTANLLVYHGGNYYINDTEKATIYSFLDSNLFFDKYDPLYYKADISIEDINSLQDDWFHYVNQRIETDIFTTDIFEYLGIDKAKYSQLEKAAVGELIEKAEATGEVSCKQIGDVGESLVHGHECMRVKQGGREDLIHMILHYPNALAAGFDIQSFELDGLKRYIEVKTTISSKKIVFDTFYLSPNEWVTAETLDGRYFIYRLMVSKHSVSLFIIQDPVAKYKDGRIKMVPKNGAEITFSEDCGIWETLLEWQN